MICIRDNSVYIVLWRGQSKQHDNDFNKKSMRQHNCNDNTDNELESDKIYIYLWAGAQIIAHNFWTRPNNLPTKQGGAK